MFYLHAVMHQWHVFIINNWELESLRYGGHVH